MATDVKLSRVERNILINQFEILKRLDPDDAESYEDSIEILRWGYEILYDQVMFSGADDGLSAEEGRYVMDVLDMYALLQSSAEHAKLDDHRLKFHGFDDHREGLHQGLAQHLRRNGRWDYLKAWNDDLKSAFVTRRKYEAMLAVFRPMYAEALETASFDPLTEEQVLMVLDAGQPPSA